MSDIVLSAGVRQNLLALQNTAQLMSITQNRLATGKKVNSALDNPFNFFTSQSLNNRANDLNSLLDSIGQAQQTLSAADDGITAITKLVQSAKAIAKQANQVTQPAATYNLAITGNTAITADASTAVGSVAGLVGGVGGTTLTSKSITNGQTITIDDGAGGTYTYTATIPGDTVQSVIDAFNNSGSPQIAGVTLSLDGSGHLVATDTDATKTLTISGTASAALFGTTTASTVTNATLGGIPNGDTLTVTVGSASPQTITFGAGNVQNRAQLATALGNLTGVTASIDGTGHIAITSTSSDTVTIGGSAASSFFAATNIGSNTPTATVTSPSDQRSNLQDQYNDLLSQIDQLAQDSSYNGVNLLYGDNLKVTFNEDGSSFLPIDGVTFNSAGLGLTPLTGDEFQTNGSVDTVLAAVDTALTTLRSQAADFGSKLGTVQTRQDFTKSLINTLQTGADNLVLADSNEEGANMLALQTRQQLSTTALSLSAQADQAVLRLFG